MTRHDDTVRFQHMLDYAKEAVALAANRTRSELDDDRLLELGLVRLLEIIGEAATRVSPESRITYPEIPWIHIAGMRNRLIHGYDEIDLNVLWDTIEEDLPPLIDHLRQILAKLKTT